MPCELGLRYPTLQAILSGKRDITTDILPAARQEHGLKTKATSKRSANPGRHHYQGKQCIDIHLLTPARVWGEIATAEAVGNQRVVDADAVTAIQHTDRLASGSTTLTEQHIQFCAGCLPNWLSGSATITGQILAFCRRS